MPDVNPLELTITAANGARNRVETVTHNTIYPLHACFDEPVYKFVSDNSGHDVLRSTRERYKDHLTQGFTGQQSLSQRQ